MHIAIIADNIADRKQLERLLGRANDILISKVGTLYIYAYGNENSLLKTPMKYDLIFIDITLAGDFGKSLIDQLTELKAPAQIVLCLPEHEPFSYQTVLNGLFTIYKPIQTQTLHKTILDVHQSIHKKSIPMIEIRGEEETAYVPIEQIVYAQSIAHLVSIHLDDNSSISMLGEIEDFYRWVDNYPEFLRIKKDMVINQNHVISKTKKQYILTNNIVISLSPFSFLKQK